MDNVGHFRFGCPSFGTALMDNRFYTIQEVANILGVSTKTLRRWDQRGRFVPTRTAGNQRRYTREQIEKLKTHLSPEGENSKLKNVVLEASPAHSLPSILNSLPFHSILRHNSLLRSTGNFESKSNKRKEKLSHRDSSLRSGRKFSLFKTGLMLAGLVLILSFAGAVLMTKYSLVAGLAQKKDQFAKFIDSLPQVNFNTRPQNLSIIPQEEEQAVLAAAIGDSDLRLNVSVPSIFSDMATFSAGLSTDNHDIDAGTGTLTASNVLYGVIAGTGISISTGQTPTITNTGVVSLGGKTGTVALTAGTDISISDVTINNKSTLSSVRGRGGCTDCIVDNDVINSITISSSGNVSGTAITSGTVGTTVGGTGLTSYTTGDMLYASAANTLSKLSLGTSGQVLIASSSGIPQWSSSAQALVTIEESNVTINNASTLNFLGGDFDLSESPSGQANIQLATTLTTPTGVSGNWDIGGTLTAGTSNAFSVSAAGTITIPATEDIVFGSVGLNDAGTSNVTSGASKVGVYDELANSSGTNVQDVLDDLDAAIGAGSSKWAQDTGFVYLTNTTDDVVLGGSTVAGASLYFDESASNLYLGTNQSANGILTLYSSGASVTDPTITTDSSGNLVIDSTNFDVTTTGINSAAIGQTTAAAGSFTTLTGTGDVTLNDAGADNILIGAAADTVTITSNTLSLTDNQWSVSAAGAASFASVDSGSGTIQTTGSVFGNAFDRSSSGALTVGDTNASSVSVCNSAACDTLTLANNADADTITIGDDLDTFSLASTGLDVSSAGALSGITTITTSGTINTATITGGTLSGGTVSGGNVSGGTLTGTALSGTGSFTITGGTGASETLTLVSTSNATKGDIQFFSGSNKITSSGNLTVAGTISSAATSNQIVLQSTGVTGTLSWTPTTSNKTITLPDANGTVAVSASSPISLSAAGAISCSTCLITTTSFGGDVSGTYDNLQLGTGVVTTTEILDNTITATDLNATLTFADADYLDLSAILYDDSTPQGLRLPNTGASPASPSSGEGYIAYDATNNVIKFYDGSSWIQVSSGTGSSKWTDGGTATYLTATADDLAVGGTDPTASPFGIDESANTIYIGEGSSGNGTITFKASDADTGNLLYNTSDQFQFSGGDALFDQALTVTGALTATGTLTANGTLDANGIFTLGDDGDVGSIDTSDWNISVTGDMTNIGAITMDGSFSQTGSTTFSTGTGAISLNGTTTVTANSSLYLASGTGKLGVGTSSPDGKLEVTGAVTGKALVILNETGDQNILTASASGTTVANLTRAGGLNLTAGQGIDVLSAGTLAFGNTTAATVNVGNTAATTIALGAGGALTRTINIGTGTGADTINIGTGGTGADAITIGGNTGNIVMDGTNFDLTSAGAVTLTGHLTLSSDASEGLSGGGLSDCDDGTNSKLLWDATTNKFSCGTDGGAGAGTSKFTDSGAITWLTATSDDFTIGANNTLTAPFSVDVSANLVRIGTADTANAQINLYASDADTGSLIYNTSDQFQFSGGNILFDQNLIAGSATSLVDLSAITHVTTALQGLLLPNTGASPSNPTGGEGYIAYDATNNVVKFFDGSNWVTVSSGTGSSKWTEDGNVLYPNTVARQLGIGTATAADVISSFYVSRNLGSGALGKAVAVFNQPESQDILTASASGTTRFTVSNAGNVAMEGQLSDITDSTLTVNDALSVLGALTVTGVISDSDSNLVLSDTVDIGDASNGVRIDTSGNISDIDANLVLNDQTDIGSATTGIRIDTSGNIIDIDGNLVLNDQVDIGSTTTGVRVTTGGAISDIDGNLSLNDDTDLTGIFTVSSRTTLGSATAGVGKLTVTGAETGKALVILNETGDQNILTASASGTTVANLTRGGVLQAADLTLGLNDASATITTNDTETLTIDPAGTGSIAFHTANSTNTLDSSGNLTIAGVLSSAATSNQIVLQSTGVTGTLSWTPTTSNKTITLPDANGTVAVSASAPITLSAAGAIACATCLTTATSFAGDVSGTYDNLQLGTGVVTTTEILDNTITATDLNATLTFADADYLDLSAILYDDSTPQGLRLPNTGANPTSPSSGEGFIAYDATNNVIKFYDGSSWVQVSSGTGESKWTDGGTATYLTATADDLAIGGSDSSSEFYFDIQNGGNFAITSTADTESVLGVTASSLTTGKALAVTSTNTATTNTAIQNSLFSFTNAQTTTANTNGVVGLGVNFTNNPGIGGNTEYAMRIQNQATSNTTDNAVSALLLLDNADTSGTGSTVVTDALRITNSGGISGGVTNAINIADTTITNDIVLQNGEIISNDTDGTISLNPTTLTLSGTTTITASSLATLTTAATLTISGDVTISGGDLTVGSSAVLSDTAGTLTLGSVDAIDSTTESTLESALDIGGDVTGTGLTAVTVGKINGATLGTTTATSANLLIADGDSWESVALSSDATITSAGVLSIAANAVALATDTTGNYVATVTGGSGISVSGSGSEDAAVSLAFGALSADWNQTGAFDIRLNNASSELRILESSGDTYYGSIDVTDLSADRTFTFPDATGTVCLSTGNCSGGGSAVNGSGTANELAYWSDSDSLTSDNVLQIDATNDVLGIGLGTASIDTSVLLDIYGESEIVLLRPANIAADSDTNNSPVVRLRGTYDSDVAVGPYTSSNFNFDIRNTMTAAGTSPTSRLGFINNGGTEVVSVLSGGQMGIGATSPLATLDVRPNLTNGGTIAIASASGSTSFAGLLVDNTGTGDLFTASKSGATKFVILNNGNLQFAGTTNFLTTLASAATAARTITFPDSTGTLCLSSANCAFDGFWNSANGALYPGNTTMNLLVGGTATTSANFRATGNAAFAGTTYSASISAQSSFATLVVDNSGIGDLFTASKSGATKFVINNAGNVGIGIAAPATKLDVNGTITAPTLIGGTAADSSLTLQSAGAIGTADYIAFKVTNTNTPVMSESMRVMSTTDSSREPLLLIGYTARQDSLGLLETIAGGTDAYGGITASTFSTTNAYNASILRLQRSRNNTKGTQGALVSGDYMGFLQFLGSDETSFVQAAEITGEVDGAVSTNVVPGRLVLRTANSSGTKTEAMRIDSSQRIGINTTSPLATLDVRPNLTNGGTIAIASASGSTSFAGLLVDNTGTGDLFTASKSGATKFVILNNGNLQFAGTTNFLTTLASAATAARTITFPDSTGTICLSSANCAFDGFWNSASGALYPGNTTMDLLLGATSTVSAKFGFINVAGGNPTATISGNLSLIVPTTAGANTFNLLNNSTLNFQRSPGGDAGLAANSVLFLGNNGNVGIGTAAPTARLSVAGTSSTISNSLGNLTITPASNLVVSSGNVGIGDTDPDYLLELFDGSNTPALALSDDDIGHGVTTLAQTDVFALLSSISTTVGGLQVTGLADATGIALELKGVQSSDPTDTTPAISLIGTKASGTGVQDLLATETVLQIANNDNAAAFTVLGGGNVGVGTAAPGFLLDVQNSQDATAAAQIYNTSANVGADGLILKLGNTSASVVPSTNHFLSFETFGIGIVGSVQGSGGTGVTYATSGIADFAEYFKKEESEVIEYGSLICLKDNGMATKCDDNNSKILGVASERPAFLGGENLGNKSIAVGLVGQVQTLVSTAGGTIQSGDVLTMSSIPGVAVKATRAGQIIGKAVEGFAGTASNAAGADIGKIQVSVNISWYDPSIYIALDGTLGGITLASQGQALQTATASAQTNYVLTDDPLFKDSQDKITALEAKVNLLTVQVVQQASASAFLTEIINSQVLGAKSDLTAASSSAALSLGDVELNNATINGNLMVLGRTTVSDLGVTGNINAGLLTVNGLSGEINTLAGDLKLQSLGLGGIDILNGKIAIDTQGNLAVAGTITADEVKADSYTVVGDQSIGSATIPTGATSVEITTAVASSSSKIFLTPTSLTDKQLVVINKSDGKFRVAIPAPTTSPISFDWWIVGNK